MLNMIHYALTKKCQENKQQSRLVRIIKSRKIENDRDLKHVKGSNQMSGEKMLLNAHAILLQGAH